MDNQLIKIISSNKNIFLTAPSGYGKSTVFNELNSYYLKHTAANIIPLFIDVKDISYKDYNTDLPIQNYIYRTYSGQTIPNESFDLFSAQNSKKYSYTYLLIIDALNEANIDNKYKLIDEIKILSRVPQVKLAISSIYDFKQEFSNIDIKYLTIDAIDDEEILKYIGYKGSVDSVDKELLDILRIPMYLNIFKKLYTKADAPLELDDLKGVNKSIILSKYIEKRELDITQSAISQHKQLHQFMLYYYIPAIAYEFAKAESFSLSESEMLKLTDKLSLDYFLSIAQNLNERALINEVFANYKSNSLYKFIAMITESYAFIKITNNSYSYSHQVWRDFFAAKHFYRLLSCDKIDDIDTIFTPSIYAYTGELLGENKFENKKSLKEESSPVEAILQKHNLKSEEKLTALGTRGLIEIMKSSRHNKVVANYSNLDLTKTSFENCYCDNCDFRNCKIEFGTFTPTSKIEIWEFHTKQAVSDDGKYIALTDGKEIYIIDVKLNMIKSHLERNKYLSYSIRYLEFIGSDLLIVTFDKSISIYNIDLKLFDALTYSNGVLGNFKESDISKKSRKKIYKYATENPTITLDNELFEKLYKFKDNTPKSKGNIISTYIKRFKHLKADVFPKILGYNTDRTVLCLNSSSSCDIIDSYLYENDENGFTIIVIADKNIFKCRYSVTKENEKSKTLEKDISKIGYQPEMIQGNGLNCYIKDDCLISNYLIDKYAATNYIFCPRNEVDECTVCFEKYDIAKDKLYKKQYKIKDNQKFDPRCPFSEPKYDLKLVYSINDNELAVVYTKTIYLLDEKQEKHTQLCTFNGIIKDDIDEKNYIILHNYTSPLRIGILTNNFFKGNPYYLTNDYYLGIKDSRITLHKKASFNPYSKDDIKIFSLHRQNSYINIFDIINIDEKKDEIILYSQFYNYAYNTKKKILTKRLNDNPLPNDKSYFHFLPDSSVSFKNKCNLDEIQIYEENNIIYLSFSYYKKQSTQKQNERIILSNGCFLAKVDDNFFVSTYNEFFSIWDIEKFNPKKPEEFAPVFTFNMDYIDLSLRNAKFSKGSLPEQLEKDFSIFGANFQ